MKSRFDWRAAYFHVVSLVGMIVFIVAAIGAGHGVLRLVFPKLSMPQDKWERMESFDAYRRGLPKDVRAPHPDIAGPAGPDATAGENERETSEAELRARWEDEKTLMVEGQRRRGLWDLIQSLVTALIVLPIFWWHRRGAKRLKYTESAGD